MFYPKDIDFYLGQTGYAAHFAAEIEPDIHAFLAKAVRYCKLYKIPYVNFEKLLVKLLKDYARSLDNFFEYAENENKAQLQFNFGERVDLL